MTTTPSSSFSLLATVEEVAITLRMELAFLATFLAIWSASRYFDVRLDDLLGLRRRPHKKTAWTPPHSFTSPTASKLEAAAASAAQPPRSLAADAGSRTKAAFPKRNTTAAGTIVPTTSREALAAIHQGLKSQEPHQGLTLYRRHKASGLLDLKKITETESCSLFMGLITTAIRGSQPSQVLWLLKECREEGPGISLPLLVSATKLTTANQQYKACLAIYDYVSEDSALVIDDRSVWSCLLFCAVETRSYKLAPTFWAALKEAGEPTYKDFGNMMRYASTRTDWELALELLADMKAGQKEIERVVYNTALAICVSAQRLDEALNLLEVMEQTPGLTDVITYNTLAKGYAKDGQLDVCLELQDRIRKNNLEPSQVTYGIVLDCCINQNQMEKAQEIFKTMLEEGCAMNTVLYTTMIKGFTRAERVEDAMKIYEQMCRDTSGNVSPDVITYSILVKANCDAGRLDRAFSLLEAMMERKLAPDEVIFNNLIAGCAHESNTQLAKRLYTSMIEGGIQPSTATFSILIRLYTSCRMMDEAVELLSKEPSLRGVEAQPRLFLQLMQCCLRDRQGRRAVEVYKLMPMTPTVAMHGQMLSTCGKLNMLDTGAELLALAAARGAEVSRHDVNQLKEIALRKKKAACITAIDEATAKLKLVA